MTSTKVILANTCEFPEADQGRSYSTLAIEDANLELPSDRVKQILLEVGLTDENAELLQNMIANTKVTDLG